MKKEKSPMIRISRERKELLAKYATAAGFLYGVISIDELTQVFNRYEDGKTNAEEMSLGLSRLLKTDRDEFEYSMFEDLVTGPDFLPEYEEDRQNALIVRQYQKGKPRYLPIKEEFLRYIDPDYYEPQKPYEDLKAYILSFNLSKQCVDIDDVDGDLIDLREMIQTENFSINRYMDYFNKRGYDFPNIETANTFLQKVMEVHNNTRLFENNGLTPNELSVISPSRQAPPPGSLPKYPFEESGGENFAGIGRNDPCPCGSGLKFKKCHGSGKPAQNKLGVSDREHFYRLWYGLLAYVNGKYNFSPKIQRDLQRNNYRTIDVSQIERIRDKVWEKPELIDEYAKNCNIKLSTEDRATLQAWKEKHIKGRFNIIKHFKDFSVLMRFDQGEDNLLYGVIGQMNSIEHLFPRQQLPRAIEAVLLPFKGKIVHDTLLASYEIAYQTGAKDFLEKLFNEQLNKKGLVTTIE